MRWSVMVLLGFLLPTLPLGAGTGTPDAPSYTPDGQLKFPADYREWVFLTSGIDMSYTPGAAAVDHSQFDNVFVNPTAYRGFLKTGVWPEGTVMVLENRGAEGNKSINQRGKTQSLDVVGLEVHVKNSAHIEGAWGFYGFDNHVSAKLTARPASCYTCHEAHAAVDTTFVQFYPTLQPTAREKGTFSKAYLKDLAKE